MDSKVLPLEKKKKHNPPLSFLSLPDEIILHCVARISRSYYPKLVLVSKTFHDLRILYTVGLEYYTLRQTNDLSPDMLVRNKESSSWRQAPNMTVARVNAVAAVLDRKIYVMGGFRENESTNWAEVFDTKTQTWESLPDPGAELRTSSIRKIEVKQGKLNVRTNGKKDYAYDPKEGKWVVVQKSPILCYIGNIWYYCDDQQLLRWYDTKRKEWRVVTGLAMLNKNLRGSMIEIAEYEGKLLILWDKFVYHGRDYKNIWCAVIALARCNSDGEEVLGEIKWANIVLTVHSSYIFLRSLKNRY